MDMNSGGGQKLAWEIVLIEAPEPEAVAVFTRMFDRDPSNVTCWCCGEDYSVSNDDSLEELTEYDRKWCRERNPLPLEEYLLLANVKVVRAQEIIDALNSTLGVS